MAYERAPSENAQTSADEIISNLSPEQCHALYLALKQKYESDDAPPEPQSKTTELAPQDKVYDEGMIP